MNRQSQVGGDTRSDLTLPVHLGQKTFRFVTASYRSLEDMVSLSWTIQAGRIRWTHPQLDAALVRAALAGRPHPIVWISTNDMFLKHRRAEKSNAQSKRGLQSIEVLRGVKLLTQAHSVSVPGSWLEEDTYPSFEQQAAAPPSTGKQSQELLREMRRLRQQMEQMAELEKLAAGRDPGFPTDKLGAMSSLSVSSGSRPSVSNNAQGPGQWSPMADRSGPSARRVFRPHALSESHLGSTPFPAQDGILSAWEYRPHEDDPVDAAVARLVNRGRYRAWRALLCRLEHGVYLCGTKRVHIRVDEEQGLLEASKDGGRTWADLREIVT
ncbi:Trim28 [Symbiodinium microadriaticum]|nr:Trim28 [Symbiodinium microadriaticum]